MVSIPFPTFLSCIPEYVEEIIPTAVSHVNFMLFQSFRFDIQNLVLLIHLSISSASYKASHIMGTKHILIVLVPWSHLALSCSSAYTSLLLLLSISVCNFSEVWYIFKFC